MKNIYGILIIATIVILVTKYDFKDKITIEEPDKYYVEESKTEVEDEKKIEKEKVTKEDNTEGRFYVLDKQNISDETTNGIIVTVLVDKETRVMYVMTTKFRDSYGVGLEVMVNEEGKPLIYEGIELD